MAKKRQHRYGKFYIPIYTDDEVLAEKAVWLQEVLIKTGISLSELLANGIESYENSHRVSIRENSYQLYTATKLIEKINFIREKKYNSSFLQSLTSEKMVEGYHYFIVMTKVRKYYYDLNRVLTLIEEFEASNTELKGQVLRKKLNREKSKQLKPIIIDISEDEL